MKVLVFFLILASAGQLNAQRSNFVQYLLDLQYITEPLHQYIVNVFAEARAELSVALTDLNDEGVQEITAGLRSVITIRDRTDEAVAELITPENQECVNGAVASWPTVLETVGSVIAGCADVHVDPIYEQTEGLHLYIQEHNQLAFNAQNMVLNVFTDLNPLTDADQITPIVSNQIDEISEQIENIVEPEIRRRLVEITNLRNSVPTDIATCVDAGVATFDTAAQEILAAATAC